MRWRGWVLIPRFPFSDFSLGAELLVTLTKYEIHDSILFLCL
jgi:hypothetical protein